MTNKIDKYIFENKSLLITGGTGSFGESMLKRMLKTNIHKIRIFSRDEYKQNEMLKKYSDKRIEFYIGDVYDYDSINCAMIGIDYVFHAAALKQVPSCESFPAQTVKTNVIGSENVMNSAIVNGVGKVIMLSTDKAVYPLCAMGMSKSLMEKAMVAHSKINPKTIFCATRFGNVMMSRGSVIPLFIKQITSGEDITITDPNMTRFIMSLDDAVELVIYAFENGNQGDIFVHKSPSCTTLNLANAVMDIMGGDSDIKIIGARIGEKQHEFLVSKEEMLKAVDLGDFFKIPANGYSFNNNSDGHSSCNTKILTKEEVIDILNSAGVK